MSDTKTVAASQPILAATDHKQTATLTAEQYAAQYTISDLLFGEWKRISSADHKSSTTTTTATTAATATATDSSLVQLITLWNDFSMKYESSGRADNGRTVVLIDQAGVYAVVDAAPPAAAATATATTAAAKPAGSGGAAPTTTTAAAIPSIRLSLGTGTEIRNSRDVVPVFGEVLPRTELIPLHAFGRDWRRVDQNATIEIALARLVEAMRRPPQQRAKPVAGSDIKTAPQPQTQPPPRLNFPPPEPKPEPVVLPVVATTLPAVKPDSDRRGRPSAAGRAKLALSLLARILQSADSKTGSSGSGGSGGGGGQEKEKEKEIVRCCDAFHVMASNGTFFSEFAFFVRFYVSSKLEIAVCRVSRAEQLTPLVV